MKVLHMQTDGQYQNSNITLEVTRFEFEAIWKALGMMPLNNDTGAQLYPQIDTAIKEFDKEISRVWRKSI